MGPHRGKNVQWLCWQRPAANYCSGQLVGSCENGNKGISTATSSYEVMTSVNTADWEDFVCAVIICRVCRLVTML
jgi:hypothetical protein